MKRAGDTVPGAWTPPGQARARRAAAVILAATDGASGAVARGFSRPTLSLPPVPVYGARMLEMRPDCERCGADLPAEAPGAFICSFECTFCADCADALDERCPNCGGELLDRPTRTGKALRDHPATAERRFRG